MKIEGENVILAPGPWDADLLRQYSEGRERGNRARTFEGHLRERTRALLRIRDGLVVAIDQPG